MPDLIAQGPNIDNRWRRRLEVDATIVLGRKAGVWSIPWDPKISRQHAEATWRGSVLHVSQMAEATNSIFHRGHANQQLDVQVGDHFVIGDTTFSLVAEPVNLTVDFRPPMTEQTFSAGYLHKLRFRHADQRIDVLSRLPGIIARANSDSDLFDHLVNLLLSGIPQASAAALVKLDAADADAELRVLHWDHRFAGRAEFTPSERLIRKALDTEESVVHIWQDSESSSYTQADNLDWAFCTPVLGSACRGWAIYLAGRLQQDSDDSPADSDSTRFQDDLKFTELAATTLASLQDVRRLERMNQFFSPIVVEAIAGRDPDEVLTPREADVAVLFCDLRGFSRRSEQQADDLFGLLNRVSDALGVMTSEILRHSGVVGDFHGDAAMGFWGWPLAREDYVRQACLAALAIRNQFAAIAEDKSHPLADFRIGIGLASGRAVAGKIGTADQVKVTVFGPVVNLASRLESMTKKLHTPILLDDLTGRFVREHISPEHARVRRVAVVKPYGVEQSVEICELLPGESDPSSLSTEQIQAYESALDALLRGDWEQSFQLLHNVPATDQVKDLLTVFIAQHNRTAPADWNGVIPL